MSLLGEEDILVRSEAFTLSPTLFFEMTDLKAFFFVVIIDVEMLSEVRIIGSYV